MAKKTIQVGGLGCIALIIAAALIVSLEAWILMVVAGTVTTWGLSFGYSVLIVLVLDLLFGGGFRSASK